MFPTGPNNGCTSNLIAHKGEGPYIQFFGLECDSLDLSKVRSCVYRLSAEKSLNVTYHAHKGGNELVDIALWREHRGRHTNAGPRCYTIAVNCENIEIAQ